MFACAMRPERLPPVHRSYYRMLESPQQQRAFLAMDSAAREAYAQKSGFVEAWNEVPKVHQDRVLLGQIAVGFDRFSVHMAWGRPADEKTMAARGRQLLLETFIRCTSGPRASDFVLDHLECDGTSSETQVVFEDDRVIELRALD